MARAATIVLFTSFVSTASASLGAWTLVLRSTPSTGQGIVSLLESATGLNENQDNLWSTNPNVTGVLKSGFIDNQWHLVKKVKMEMYNVAGDVVMWMEFDGVGSSKTSWFTRSRLLSSNYQDQPENSDVFTIAASFGRVRCFYVADHVNCGGDENWSRVTEIPNETVHCTWDNYPIIPRFFYSSASGKQKASDLSEASLFSISILTECEPNADTSSSSGLANVRMCKRSGRYLLSLPIVRMTVVSNIECGKHCLLTDGCKTYNYHRNVNVCELLPVCANSYTHLSNEDDYEFWGYGNC